MGTDGREALRKHIIQLHGTATARGGAHLRFVPWETPTAIQDLVASREHTRSFGAFINSLDSPRHWRKGAPGMAISAGIGVSGGWFCPKGEGDRDTLNGADRDGETNPTPPERAEKDSARHRGLLKTPLHGLRSSVLFYQ